MVGFLSFLFGDEYDHVNFGKYHYSIPFINQAFHNICKRITIFVKSAGKDKYNRKADCEGFLHFILFYADSSKQVEELYYDYVMYQLNKPQTNHQENTDERPIFIGNDEFYLLF